MSVRLVEGDGCFRLTLSGREGCVPSLEIAGRIADDSAAMVNRKSVLHYHPAQSQGGYHLRLRLFVIEHRML